MKKELKKEMTDLKKEMNGQFNKIADHLTHTLKFGYYFNQEMKENTLPTLQFRREFNQDISLCLITLKE